MSERQVPVDAVAGRRTPTFTADSVPPALLSAHHTTVWAELFVLAGNVRFVEEEPRWQAKVIAPASQAIVPHRKHHVEPSPDAEFYVQFYDEPS